MNREIMAACTLLAVAAGWFGLRMADSPSTIQTDRIVREHAAASSPSNNQPPKSMAEGFVPVLNADASQRASSVSRSPQAMPTDSAVLPSSPTGAEMVERWLSTTDATAGAMTVLQHWSSLKPEEQLPALGRILNMVPDDRYEAVQRVLTDPTTTREAEEVIFRDAVNRSSEVKLHTMLALIAQPQHPLASMAHEALVNDLGIDDGPNQGAWIAHVQEHLRGLRQR